LPLVVTVVIGTKGTNIVQNYQTNVRVSPEESGLPLETVFMCFQIRSISSERFQNSPAGKLNQEKLTEIEQAVKYCLGL
ncbi:MAG: type II toxin-antitoxin system PemK/MazF family toxin, partial [Microcystaceae cyanobacterium]